MTASRPTALLLFLLLGLLAPASSHAQTTPPTDAAAFHEFSSKGHPKALGLHFTFKYPREWQPQESDSSLIVQSFATLATNETVVLTVRRGGLPQPGSLSPQELVKQVAMQVTGQLPASATVISDQPLEVAGRPAHQVEYTRTTPRGDATQTMRVTLWILMHEGTALYFITALSARTPEEAALLPQRVAERRPTYLKMASSIVFHPSDKPQSQPPAAAAPTTTPRARPATTARIVTPVPASPSSPQAPKTFSTQDNPKAFGAALSLQLPPAWTAHEVPEPDLVQEFRRADSSATITLSCLPYVAPAGGQITPQQRAEMIDPARLKAALPPTATFIGSQVTQIAGQPACMIGFSEKEDVLGTPLISQRVNYVFEHEGHLFLISCSVSVLREADVPLLSQQMARIKPEVQSIMQSITLGPPK